MILQDINGSDSAAKANQSERPNTVGSKRQLKKEHGSMGMFVANMLRYMALQYNVNQVWNWPTGNGSEKNVRTPVDEIILNYKYYKSEQSTGDNTHLTETTDGTQLPAKYTNGPETFQVVQHMVGPVTKTMSGITITLESQDPSVMSQKKRRITAITAKKELKEIFAEFAKLGADFSPERRFDRDIDTALTNAIRDPSHKIERLGLDLLNKINADQCIKELVPRQFRDVAIGGHCALHRTVSAGRLKMQKIPNWLTIWDRLEDDDHNKRSSFKGFIEYLSKNEIYQKFPDLTPDEKFEINKVFESGSEMAQQFPAMFPPDTNFQWFNDKGSRRMVCVTGYFIATIVPDKGDPYHTIYQGTLIGNLVLKSYWGEGQWEEQNIVYDMADPAWPLMPIWIYSPDTVMGSNVPMVSRFRHMQEDCDAYLYKIRQLVERDLGKNYNFNGNIIGDQSAREIIDNFKKFGVNVSTTATGEEQVTGQARMLEVVDLSMDANVSAYSALREQMKKDMMDVASQSDITNGAQQTYIGGGTQQQTVALAGNGMVTMYQGFYQHFTFIQQYMLNSAKLILRAAKSKEEAEIMMSEGAGEFWEALNDEKLQIEDMLVYVRIEDNIDEQKRARLNQIALALAQNTQQTGFTMSAAIKLEQARTTRELERSFLEVEEKVENKQLEERMQAMEQQQAMQQSQQQFEGQKFQAEEQGKAGRDQIRNQPKHEQNQIELMKLRREMQMQEPQIPVSGA